MDAFMKLPNGQEDSDAEADDVFVYEGSQARDVPDPVTESAVHLRGSEVDPEVQRTEAQMRNFLEEMEQRQHGPGASQTRDVPNRDSRRTGGREGLTDAQFPRGDGAPTTRAGSLWFYTVPRIETVK